MPAAPLNFQLADGPEGGQAWWAQTSDDVRIRLAYWPGGSAGTVFLLPGRTEYIEKYGRTARDFVERGYGVLCIDWRGQGLADRVHPDPMMGHVEKFSDYQADLHVLIEKAREKGLPEPYFMVAHSMGGCIGLRALHNHPDLFKAVVFSGPMWGILMEGIRKPVGWMTSTFAHFGGLGNLRTPATSGETYVLTSDFKGNVLTSDREMWDYMARQTREISGVGLGGPSLNWLYEALHETLALQKMPTPDLPALTFMGSNERIVMQSSIQKMMQRWPNGRLEVVPGAEHEVMMEGVDTRRAFADAANALFAQVPSQQLPA